MLAAAAGTRHDRRSELLGLKTMRSKERNTGAGFLHICKHRKRFLWFSHSMRFGPGVNRPNLEKNVTLTPIMMGT